MNAVGEIYRQTQEDQYQQSLSRADRCTLIYEDALESCERNFKHALQLGVYDDFGSALDYERQDEHGTPAPTMGDAAQVILEAARNGQPSAINLLNRMAKTHAFHNVEEPQYF